MVATHASKDVGLDDIHEREKFALWIVHAKYGFGVPESQGPASQGRDR